MSDPRFARLKSDPRFRRPKKQQSKVVVDERFKEVFEDGKAKGKKEKKSRVDKYGRKVSDTHESDGLRRFYRLENEEENEVEDVGAPAVVDYARGGVLMESSDEEDEGHASGEDDTDSDGIVTLGADPTKPSPDDDDDAEVDLDEDVLADLDAQAAAYAEVMPSQDNDTDDTSRTRRLAIVNLDWDHVRATHLFKIFSSLVSPTAPIVASPSSLHIHPDRKKAIKTSPTTVARGNVLSVRVYPSEFGKERMAREEKEGPPVEVFKKAKSLNEDEVNEKTIYETGDGEDYDEDALRKYQLERLRYYYAIVECDTVAAASHIYSELEGTELERSANVFDLSFVPDDMTFDSVYRDEATSESSMPYKAVEFVTDALRHSKVKLTWDEDDPERTRITRRNLTRQEIEEADFRAYIASSSSGSESEAPTKETRKGKGKKAERDKLRALLLDGEDNELPEGWGREEDEPGDMDMEIMFTPGLSDTKNKDQDETTLEKYQRKMKDKRKKRKEEKKLEGEEKKETKKKKGVADDDDFFDAGSEDDEGTSKYKKKQEKTPPLESTAEELALLVASDKPGGEPAHFDMKSVLKSEKKKGKGKKKGKKQEEDDQEIQADFTIDVKDDRFKAVHEDHQFAIDPSNPHFKKTKSMAALLDERVKRQKDRRGEGGVERERSSKEATGQSLKSLVESVKRKSASYDQGGVGKRRKL